MAAQPGPFGTPAADHSEATFFYGSAAAFWSWFEPSESRDSREIGIMLDFAHHPRLH